MLIMRRINCIDHCLAGFLLQHIDVVREAAAVVISHVGTDHDADPPNALGDVPVDQAVLKFVRQIHGGGKIQAFSTVAMAAGHHLNDLLHVLLQKAGRVQLRFGHGANHICHTLSDQLFPQMGPLRCFQIAVGVAGGEVAVVQQPDLHVKLFGGLQNEAEIFPPGFLAEVLVGPAFGAEFPDAACLDGEDLLFDSLLSLSVEP